MKRFLPLALCVCWAMAADANLISEFEPNPPGGDPADTTLELFGTAGQAFNFNIYSIENDGINGTVDRASNVTGTFDALGLSVVTVPDLENPSFTVLLTDGTVPLLATGTDLDSTDSGTLDVSALGTIFDAVAVSDAFADDATLYAASLGGTNILYNGEFEPLGVFRSGSDGEWFQFVTADFGQPTERLAVFAADGGPELSSDFFPAGDPTTTSFGAINPTAVPEPSSLACLGMLGAGAVYRRVRRRSKVA